MLSPGDDGDVEQSNSTTAIAAGLNDNKTKQSIDQTQGSASKEKAPEAKETAEKDGHTDKGGSYTQVAGQEADNEQKADADATAVQWKPSNSNDSIRVGSKGDGGNVTQSNDATAIGIAANDNKTKQSIDQTQGSAPMAAKAPEDAKAEEKKDGHADKGSSYTQIAGKKADSDQKAFADATAVQVKPSNENSSIRVGSKGDDGDVEQSNSTTAIAPRLNDNKTKQSIDQTQGGGSGSGYLQVAGQEAGTRSRRRTPTRSRSRSSRPTRTPPFASSRRATTVTSRNPTARPRSRPRSTTTTRSSRSTRSRAAVGATAPTTSRSQDRARGAGRRPTRMRRRFSSAPRTRTRPCGKEARAVAAADRSSRRMPWARSPSG